MSERIDTPETRAFIAELERRAAENDAREFRRLTTPLETLPSGVKYRDLRRAAVSPGAKEPQ